MEGNEVRLNEYEATFYHVQTRMEMERVGPIYAMNPAAAERMAWQELDARHGKEAMYSRRYYRISVKGPGQ